jgi:hypothetical protein
MKRGSSALIIALILVASAPPLRADSPAASPQAAVEITFRTVGKATLPPAWEVLLRPSEAQDEPPARHPASPGEPLLLRLAPGSSWEVSADLSGFWVRRQTLVVGPADETSRLELYLWPLGKISGRLSVQQKDVALPRNVLVKTVAAPAILKRPPMPPGFLACPIDKDGNWSCSLPAATYDLVVHAEGFIPHYRWGVEVPPIRTLPLGTFRLERGGSVAAWVAAEGGAIDPARAVARLALLAACDTDIKANLELDRVAVERAVSRDGFLQITGLAPGNYSLEVRQPGWAPARVPDIRVAPQSETFLPEPLLLMRPIALDFEIVPPLAERGERWRAQVSRRAENSRPAALVFDGPVDAEGRFTVPDQSPGWFRVRVLDSQGNRVHSEPERQLDASTRHRIEVHRIAVEGRLRLGSEPLAGTLWFGGRYGVRRVKMEADKEGRFAGILSADGFWIVDVEAAEPRFRIRTRTEIRPDRSGSAAVTIDLPGTRVFGRVVGQDGQPPSRAFLLIATQGLDQMIEADEVSAFDVRGFPAGLLSLIAKDDGAAQSDRVVVNAVEGAEIGPIELRLRPVRRINGTVRSQLGPVAGARIVAIANSPAVGGGDAMTGPEGTFTLELPADIPSATALVRAPGFGTQAFRLVADGPPVSLTVSEAAGEIAIALPRGTLDLQRENLRVALFQNGLEVPVPLLREDASSTIASGRDGVPFLRLANLAPGPYSACIQQKQVGSKGSLEHNPEVGVSCAAGQLEPGATLALTLRDDD